MGYYHADHSQNDQIRQGVCPDVGGSWGCMAGPQTSEETVEGEYGCDDRTQMT